jgi:plasmid stability protein
MPDILVRGVKAEVVERLKMQAKRNGRSLQSEAKRLLENAAGRSIDEALEAGRSWRKRLGRSFEDSARLIREDRER